MLGDASQLGQLFQNLLSNALKFRRAETPPIVTIRAQTVAATDLPPSIKPTRAATTYHQIEVADNGIGFDPQAARVTKETDRGLGLVGMRERAALVGGTVEIESDPIAGGTTIFVRVPWREGEV